MKAPNDVTVEERAMIEDLHEALEEAAAELESANRLADELHVRGVIRYLPGVVEGAKRGVARALALMRED